MSGDRDDEQPGGPSPQQQRDMVGNRTMQLDALSEEMFEDLDYPDRDEPAAVAPPAAAPPPLPKRRPRRWNATAVAALLGVVLLAAVLGLIAANLLFGDDEPAEVTAEGAEPATAGEAEPAPEPPPDEEGEPEFVPLELDEVVIESGNTEGDDPPE